MKEAANTQESPVVQKGIVEQKYIQPPKNKIKLTATEKNGTDTEQNTQGNCHNTYASRRNKK